MSDEEPVDPTPDLPPSSLPPPPPPPKKRGRKAKAPARAALLDSLSEGGTISPAERDRLAKRVGADISKDEDIQEKTQDQLIEEQLGREYGPRYVAPPRPAPPAASPPDPFGVAVGDMAARRAAVVRDKTPLSDVEKARLLAMVAGGFNAVKACYECGFDWRRYKKTVREDEEFRVDVFLAHEKKENDCAFMLYESALNNDLSSAVKYINHHNGGKIRSHNIKMQKIEMSLRQKDQGGGGKEPRPGVGKIPRGPQFDDFNDLEDRQRAGGHLTDAELVRLGRYQQIIFSQTTPETPAPPVSPVESEDI